MYIIVVVSACLAWAGVGRRLQVTHVQMQQHLQEKHLKSQSETGTAYIDPSSIQLKQPPSNVPLTAMSSMQMLAMLLQVNSTHISGWQVIGEGSNHGINNFRGEHCRRNPARRGIQRNPVRCNSVMSSLPLPRAFIYVDPCDNDLYDQRYQLTCDACASAGMAIVPVWSTGFARGATVRNAVDPDKVMLAPPAGEEAQWVAKTLGEDCEVVGVLSGTDAGSGTAERLVDALLPAYSNGINSARRDKFEMHEALRAAGLAAASQTVAAEWSEAQAFLEQLPKPMRAIVKPRRGSGSVRVGLATTLDEAHDLFAQVLEQPASLDDEADTSSVLLQEFLDGEEWVVDTVSRAGEHKVLALWRYEKGEANGAPFVYFGITPTGLGSDRARRMAQYALGVLDAMQWQWGPVHMEVMWMGEERGPVLIEVNTGRMNGEEFKLLADVLYGVSKYDATFAALIDKSDEAWDLIPHMPPDELRAAGKLVKLVSYVSGKLRFVCHEGLMNDMASFVRLHLDKSEPGDYVKRTTNLNTCAGDVVLIHEDVEVVEREYAILRALQPSLFEVDADDSAENEVQVAPADRLRWEAEEAIRIASLALDSTASALDEDTLVKLHARFPLIHKDFELSVPPGCVAAEEHASRGARRVGEVLLIALRSAANEEEAIVGIEALFQAPASQVA